MIKIEVETIITTYFGEVENIDILPLSTLVKIKDVIFDKFKNIDYVNVDLSGEAIRDFVYSNRKYFSFNESKTSIIYKHDEEFYEDLFGIFYSKIDYKYKWNIIKTIEDFVENEKNIKNKKLRKDKLIQINFKNGYNV